MRPALALLLAISMAACQGGAPTARATAAAPSPSCVGPDAHLFEVTTMDGQRHRVATYGFGPVVVVAHESGQDLCAVVGYATWLRSNGYTGIAVDLEGHEWDQTVAAVAAAVRARGASSIQVLGASMGGAAAVVASAEIAPPLRSVISLSGERKVKGLDADAAVARSRVPLLIVAGADDGYLDQEDARALLQESAATDKNLFLLPGRAHGFDLLDGPDGPQVRQRVLDFLHAHAG